MGSGKGKTRRASGLQSGSRITSGAKGFRITAGSERLGGLGLEPNLEALGFPPKVGAQTLTAKSEVEDDVMYSPGKWRDFLHDSGLDYTKLYRYYLKRGSLPTPSQAEYQTLLDELFADAVDMDVVVLPDQYTREDFKIVVRPHQSFGFIAEISLKSNPNRRAIYEGVARLGEDIYLVNVRVNGALMSLAQSLYGVLRTEK